MSNRMKLCAVLAFIFVTNLTAQDKSALLTTPKSDVFMQGFYWNSPPGGIWWDSLAILSTRLASAGFSAIWLPSSSKGAGGGMSMGYDPYDHYDFGDYNQKGSLETRFGSKAELKNAINAFHSVGMQVFADAVVRHMMGGEQKIPYECRPLNNGNYIVPDSAYMLFQYPSGPGRFRKTAASFYPNSQNCWVDPLFVQTDPIFRFGEWLDHNKQSVKDSLIAWGRYLRQELGYDGFRLDAVKSINPAFMAQWLNGSNPGGYAVAELWGSTSEIGNWLQVAKYQNGANVSMFDFPLRYNLRDMCNTTNGGFNMNNLDGAGLINSGFSGFDVSTFLENHDFDRKGWDGQIDTGHDPVIYDKALGYAYILFSEGRPSVFFKDYIDYGVGGKIDTLIWIRQNFLGGGTTKRAGLNPYYIRQDGNTNQGELSNDIYVAKRNGYGNQPGGYIVMNDNPTQWIDVWVDTDKPVGTWYKDYTGRDANKQVVSGIGGNPPNRIKLWAPPRSYTIYVPDTTKRLNNPPALLPVADQTAYTNSLFTYQVKASDANDTALVYSLQGNPGWLTVSNKGLLTGTPVFADTGRTNVIVTVSDPGGASEKDTFAISVYKNLPPAIAAIPDTAIKATVRYECQPTASDPDSDSLRFFFAQAPNFLNVDQITGKIVGTPSLSDTGYYAIQLKVTDGKGAYGSANYNLRVKANLDTVIATYGKPVIDGNIIKGTSDWRPEWLIVADSDTDSYWRPVDTLNNELLGIYSTWDADSLYIGIDYKLNDTYNTMMVYIDAGIPGGETNFNGQQGYYGDYAKNFRFRPADAIDFFIPAYNQTAPGMYKIVDSTSSNMTNKINGRRGQNAFGAEVAVAWNDLYGLGVGLIPPGVKLKMVALIAGGLNYGAGDSAPDNPDVNGNAGPDSLINLALVEPDRNNDGIPDPTLFISDIKEIPGETLPKEFSLAQNFPNPFNPSTRIQFSLPERSVVQLRIYDVLGRELMTLLDEERAAGTWAVNADMSQFSSGIYFYQLVTPKFSEVRKMMLVK
ncbi:MAG: putative Ig domain-containing protein [Bacteroidetes bacterium]|nr:putative Ig domain-containing protein [Bacteroidota bacterium]